jgi:GNAT superfamily N-acetyltransferase
MQLRHARPEEVSALEALQWRASLVWEEYRADLLAHPDAIELPAQAVRDGQVRVAVDGDGSPIGFSVVIPLTGGVVDLDGLFVEPSAMRTGIGRLLVEDAVAAARGRGATRMEVTANPRAVGFYEKVGFVASGPVATRFGPGLRMYRPV